MTPDELRAEQSRLGLTQGQLAKVLDVGDRIVRRWLAGDPEIPRAVAYMVRKISKREAEKLLKPAPITSQEG